MTIFEEITEKRRVVLNERTNEVYILPMTGVNNDRLPVEAEAHHSWPPVKEKPDKLTNTRKPEKKEKTLYDLRPSQQ